jgi:hypothetical protein
MPSTSTMIVTQTVKSYGYVFVSPPLLWIGLIVADILILSYLLNKLYEVAVRFSDKKNFHFETNAPLVNRKKSIEAYLKILSTNLQNTIETICKVKGIEEIFDKNAAESDLDSYLSELESIINKCIDSHEGYYYTVQSMDHIKEFSDKLCSRLNFEANKKGLNIRFAYSPDEESGSFDVVVISQTKKYKKYEIALHKMADAGQAENYYLLDCPPEDYDMVDNHMSYTFSVAVVEPIETDIITGVIAKYMRIKRCASYQDEDENEISRLVTDLYGAESA